MGITYQDTARVRPCSLFLDLLLVVFKLCAKLTQVAPAHPCARDIPFILNITPASTETEYIWQKPLAHAYAHSRGCVVPLFRTVSDMDVATEPPWMGLRRVLERGTTWPLLP